MCSDEKVDEVYDIEDVDPDNAVFVSALTVDVNHATINPGTISTGDSFEFTYLTTG